jgi:hypothetical protein
MKQITTIALIIFLSIGCNNASKQPNQIKITKNNTAWTIDNDDVLVIEYDGCEYVRFSGGQYAWGGHKGNCKYCEQRKTTTTNDGQ